jgi:membrane associated rhomboid family serine protease
LNLGLPLLIPGISFWGHFGGVVGGSVLAFVMVWLPEKSRIRSGRKNISQGTAIVFLMTAACFAIVQIA